MEGRGRLWIGVAIVVLLLGGLAAGIYFSQRSKPAQADFEDVEAMMDTGDYAGAVTSLEQIIAAEPDNAEAHFLLGLAHFNLGEYTEAREFFERSMELDPERAAAVHHNLGVLAYQIGDIETALQEFEAALALDPEDPDSHYQLGATYLVMAFPMGADQPDAEMLARSELEFQQALDLGPEKPEALVGLGNVYLLQGRTSEAVDYLEKAVEAKPDMREALFALGRAYADLGETTLAKETLQRFLDTDPPAVWAQQAEDVLSRLE